MAEIQLESINLYKKTYGPNKGSLAGTVKFKSDFGEITVAPSLETQAKIIDIMADEICHMTSHAANNMRESIAKAVEAAQPIEAEPETKMIEGEVVADDEIPF